MWRARNDIGCLGLTWARRGQRWYLLHFLVVSNRHYAACRNYSRNAEWSTCCSTCEAQDLREETRLSAHSSRSWGRSFPQAYQAHLSPHRLCPGATLPSLFYFLLMVDAIYSWESTWSAESSEKHFPASQTELVPPSWVLPQTRWG